MSIDAHDPNDDEDPEELDEEQDEEHALGQLPETPTPAHRRNQVESRELARELWQEYASGLSTRQIADLRGLPVYTVNYYLRRYARQYGRREIDRARRMDLERIESLLDAHIKRAIKDKKVDSAKLILIMIKLRADILGYAAPKKVEHSGEQRIGVTPELADLVREIREQNQTVRGDMVRVTPEVEGQVLDAEVLDDPDS